MVRRRICWGRMILAVVILTLLLTGFIWASRWFGWFAPAPLSAKEAEEKFGIERVLSPVDYNQNGIDDYTDILLARVKTLKTAQSTAPLIITVVIRRRERAAAQTWFGVRFKTRGIL